MPFELGDDLDASLSQPCLIAAGSVKVLYMVRWSAVTGFFKDERYALEDPYRLEAIVYWQLGLQEFVGKPGQREGRRLETPSARRGMQTQRSLAGRPRKYMKKHHGHRACGWGNLRLHGRLEKE
jgi:hypothetical protein